MNDDIYGYVFLLGAVIGLIVGAVGCNSEWKSEAVRNGKAEYVASSSGKAKWRWKP